MRENFLSLNEIKNRRPGFKFYSKNGVLLELLSIKENKVPVAHGFLGSVYQNKIDIEIMDKLGNRYVECNFTGDLIGDNIFEVRVATKDWDSLDYRTVESYEAECLEKYEDYRKSKEDDKSRYIGYLEDCKKSGVINKKEMKKYMRDIPY